MPKHAARVEAYGTVDELNAAIGLARAAGPDTALDGMLARIQQELFDCGADLADPAVGTEGRPPRITQAHVERLEREIDAFTAETPPLDRFVLPGGGEVGARLHFARTVARRAERCAVAAAAAAEAEGSERIDAILIRYLNRLSDWLFAAARAANHRGGVAEVRWEPPSYRANEPNR